jgi:hypothetical protein
MYVMLNILAYFYLLIHPIRAIFRGFMANLIYIIGFYFGRIVLALIVFSLFHRYTLVIVRFFHIIAWI